MDLGIIERMGMNVYTREVRKETCQDVRDRGKGVSSSLFNSHTRSHGQIGERLVEMRRVTSCSGIRKRKDDYGNNCTFEKFIGYWGKVGAIAGNCPALLGESFLEIG